jgi:glycosyltransferase involved in cell wall biosynthesis
LDEYGDPALSQPRKNVVFLAKAAWKVKNVSGAIRMARKAGVGIEVAGGTRLNLKMGFRFTADPNAKFLGMIAQDEKLPLLRRTEALLFPVLWHEPFGAAIIEAMYYGQPVFGGIWGSLPELVPNDVGFCSDSESELVDAIRNRDQFNRQHIHQYICDQFNNQRMARDYLAAYEKVINGEKLNSQIPIKPDTPEPKRFSMKP